MVGEDEHPTKRRRLGSKLSPLAIEARFGSNASDINWQTVMRLADQTAPRVGTHVVDQGEIIQQIQHICPEYLIKHVVLCRGTDRYVGPNRPMLPQTAPLRRQICIRRQTQDIHVDPWEAWEALSKRNLRKKGVPARVSLTVFAAARQPESPDNRLPRMLPPADVTNAGAQRRSHEALETPGDADHRAKRSRGIENENMSDPTVTLAPQSTTTAERQNEATSETQNEEPPQHVIDIASQKHGPMFNSLKVDEQNWILKLHRNLGHPGATKLAEFCKQLQCPEHLLKAIHDLRCSTCQETRGPVVSRPSAIHETCDFGDVVSMDGITWTNQNGDHFHFYHFIDQSTLFHTAVATPGRSTDDACKALLTGWFNWAGPPGLLCVDSGTELNSDEFSSFLQRHSVKCRTCAAEAHWQNARTERHGGILQLMLKKMDHEQPIRTYEQLAVALSHATSTKNQWSKYKGYPPEMLVFGKGVRVPGSITSDPTVSAHSVALSNMPEGIRFRQDLATREAARKAFAEIDNDQTLRRALVHRSRPHRGFYDRGDWVMMWKKKGEADGNWLGPMQVIIQEGQNVIWVTRHHKLYRVPQSTSEACQPLRNSSINHMWPKRRESQWVSDQHMAEFSFMTWFLRIAIRAQLLLLPYLQIRCLDPQGDTPMRCQRVKQIDKTKNLWVLNYLALKMTNQTMNQKFLPFPAPHQAIKLTILNPLRHLHMRFPSQTPLMKVKVYIPMKNHVFTSRRIRCIVWDQCHAEGY